MKSEEKRDHWPMAIVTGTHADEHGHTRRATVKTSEKLYDQYRTLYC